jgi:hypothetical protein
LISAAWCKRRRTKWDWFFRPLTAKSFGLGGEARFAEALLECVRRLAQAD